MLHSGRMQVESVLAPATPELGTPEKIYERVFGQMRPRTPVPAIHVEFRRYANANAQIRLEEGRLMIRMADTLASAPEPVMEALAEILLSKLFRKPVPQ